MATIQTASMLGVTAPGFSLPATDGRTYSLSDVAGPKGTAVAFICNHCPYVKAVVGRMVDDAKTLRQEGFGFVAISCNDAVTYPEDSFDNMKRFAVKHGFTFPYLFDDSQAVGRAFDAVCTPEFYGIATDGTIQYHGRLDEGRRDPPPPGARREFVEAMRSIAAVGKGPLQQIPSVGCSIKWKHAA